MAILSLLPRGGWTYIHPLTPPLAAYAEDLPHPGTLPCKMISVYIRKTRMYSFRATLSRRRTWRITSLSHED